MGSVTKKKVCYLSLGSNLGDRLHNLRQGISRLPSGSIHLCAVSSVYESEPVGLPGADYFYNMAVKAETVLSPEDLLKICLRIEADLGRKRKKKNESRILDIDILLYDRLILKSENLEIPHPRAHFRRFVLVPLHEIAPDFIHPILLKDIDELLQNCSDPSLVRKCMKASPLLFSNKKASSPFKEIGFK